MFSSFFPTSWTLDATKESQLHSTTVDDRSIRDVMKQVKGINGDRLVLCTLRQLEQPFYLVMISTQEVDGLPYLLAHLSEMGGELIFRMQYSQEIELSRIVGWIP